MKMVIIYQTHVDTQSFVGTGTGNEFITLLLSLALITIMRTPSTSSNASTLFKLASLSKETPAN